jgi:hypothetical protein
LIRKIVESIIACGMKRIAIEIVIVELIEDIAWTYL